MSRADLQLNGQSVGLNGVPILNPLITLTVFNFDVFKVRSDLPNADAMSPRPSQENQRQYCCHNRYTVWFDLSFFMQTMCHYESGVRLTS